MEKKYAVHLESNTTYLFSELPKMNCLTTGNFDKKDFCFYSACSVQAGL